MHDIRGLHSSVYDESGLTLRVSADVIQIRHAQLLGPLRLGFLHSIEARGVSVDTFDKHPAAPLASAAADDVTRAVSALFPAPISKGVVHAEFERVRLTQHEAGHPTFNLVAHRCATANARGRIVCWNGSVSKSSATTRFREAVFEESGRCTIDGTPFALSAR